MYAVTSYNRAKFDIKYKVTKVGLLGWGLAPLEFCKIASANWR